MFRKLIIVLILCPLLINGQSIYFEKTYDASGYTETSNRVINEGAKYIYFNSGVDYSSLPYKSVITFNSVSYEGDVLLQSHYLLDSIQFIHSWVEQTLQGNFLVLGFLRQYRDCETTFWSSFQFIPPESRPIKPLRYCSPMAS